MPMQHYSVAQSFEFHYSVSYALKCQGSLWRMRISLSKWTLLKVILSVGRSAELKWHVSLLQPSKPRLLKVFYPFKMLQINNCNLISCFICLLCLRCIGIFKKITDFASTVMFCHTKSLEQDTLPICNVSQYGLICWVSAVILLYCFVFKFLSMLLC